MPHAAERQRPIPASPDERLGRGADVAARAYRAVLCADQAFPRRP